VILDNFESKLLVMPLNNIKPAKGRLLIAEPGISEMYFKRSVVLITEHNDEGTIGFVLNKPVDLKLHDALVDFDGFSNDLYLGGPVSKSNLFYIHTLGEKIEGARKILNGLYWGGEFEMIKDLIKSKQAHPSEIKFFIGYSGWDAGQLEAELEVNSWVVAPTNSEEIMTLKTDEIWGQVLKGMGRDIALLAYFPENPLLN
jgi:putative transcriptional regulator